MGNPHRFLFRERERQGLGSQVTHKSLPPWGPSWAPSHPCRPNKGDPLKVSSLSSVFSPGEVQGYWVLCWDATSVSFSSKSPSSEGSGQPLVSKGVRTSCGRVGVTTQGQQSGWPLAPSRDCWTLLFWKIYGRRTRQIHRWRKLRSLGWAEMLGGWFFALP